MADVKNVFELVTEVRDQSDEKNIRTKSNLAIVSLLGRGQTMAAAVLARTYPEPLLELGRRIELTAGVSDYDLFDDAFEDRVLYVTYSLAAGAAPVPLARRGYRDVVGVTFASNVPGQPLVWVPHKRSLRVLPAPAGGVLNVDYLRRPPKLVLPQGRVTAVGADFVVVEPIEDCDGGVSADSDQLSSFVSLIDWATGETRGSLQVQSVTSDKYVFRATPQRDSVRGVSIAGAATLGDLGVEVDDYLCLAEGSCVSFFQDTMANYLVAYGTAALRLSLDAQNQLEAAVEAECRSVLASQETGREPADRVQAGTPTWGGSLWGSRLRPTTT